MLHDPIENLTLPPRARERAPRHLLIAGVAGAVALGACAGLWARPAESERRVTDLRAAMPAPAPRPARRLEIVVDDSPSPIGAPLEVLPAVQAVSDFTPPPLEPEPRAPVRPPTGLVRVQTVEPMIAVEPPPAPPPRPERRAEPRKPEAAAPKAHARAETPKAAAKTAARKLAQKAESRPKAQSAKAQSSKAAKSKIALAKADKTKAGRAKAEKAKADRTRLAKGKAGAGKAVLAKAGHKARVAVAKTVAKAPKSKPAPKHAAAEPKARPARPKVVRAAAPRPAARPQKATPAKGSGPLRKVRNERRCASADPGAALVCANPALGAADRQMARAYRQAEAAGVPAWRLQQQHQRWLAARSAAAREAPWAVQDVYSARIAELRDLARDGGAF